MSWTLDKVILSPDSARLFRREELPRRGALFAEIGFGNGDFLLNLASARRDALCIGIEVSLTSLLKAARKVLRGGIDNVKLLNGDGSFLLREFFLPETVEGVFVNFPCPWPKKRHSKRRLINSLFADNLAGALKIGGFFELASDEKWFVDEARGCLLENGALEVGEIQRHLGGPIGTKYEQKWISLGKSIYRLRATKVSFFRTTSIVDWEEVALDINKEMPKGWRMGKLGFMTNKAGGDDRFKWAFKDAFFGDDGTGLLQVITADDGFQQKFYVRVIPRENSVLIKLDDASTVYRTPAVKGAFKALAEEIGKL